MATPKKRSSKSKIKLRRAHKNLKMPHLGKCAKTGLPKLPHTVCEESGYYNKDMRVFVVDEKL
jgi:large subunit ribosomal protein L32